MTLRLVAHVTVPARPTFARRIVGREVDAHERVCAGIQSPVGTEKVRAAMPPRFAGACRDARGSESAATHCNARAFGAFPLAVVGVTWPTLDALIASAREGGRLPRDGRRARPPSRTAALLVDALVRAAAGHAEQAEQAERATQQSHEDETTTGRSP